MTEEDTRHFFARPAFFAGAGKRRAGARAGPATDARSTRRTWPKTRSFAAAPAPSPSRRSPAGPSPAPSRASAAAPSSASGSSRPPRNRPSMPTTETSRRHARGHASRRPAIEAERHQVVEGDDAGRPTGVLRQAQAHGAADLGDHRVAVFVERAAIEHLRAVAHAGRLGRRRRSRRSCRRGSCVMPATVTKARPLVPVRDEVAGGQARRREVVRRDVADDRGPPRRQRAGRSWRRLMPSRRPPSSRWRFCRRARR